MSKMTAGMSDEWFRKEGMKLVPEIWEDGTRVDNKPGRFEWWYFDAHLDDGSTVVAIIFSKPYTNIQLPCTPQVKLSITTPSGETYLHIDEFTETDFIASNEKCDVRVGNSRICGNLDKYNIHFEVQGNTADLEFSRIAPSWRPGTGKCYFGESHKDYFGWIVPIPFGNVKGTLKYEGKERKVKGTGYHDHNFGNIALTKVIDHWYWGRLSVDDYNCIFFQMVGTEKYGSEKLPLFMFSKGKKLLTGDGSYLTVTGGNHTVHAGGKSYPEKLNFKWKNGKDLIDIMITNPEVIEARSLLLGFSFLKRKLARLFVNPFYFRWNADTKIRIDFGKIHDKKKLKSLYESMMLR